MPVLAPNTAGAAAAGGVSSRRTARDPVSRGGHVARSHQRWTLLITSVASFMVALDTLVVATALPVIGQATGAGIDALQWTVNAYTLSYATGIICAAALGDRYGRRRIFTLGLALFTTASAGCALAPSIDWLLAARAMQGLGAAVVTPLSLTILTASSPTAHRGRLVGIWSGITGLAVASGPLVGGVVTTTWGWQCIFWLNVPIGLAATALSRLRLRESRGSATRVDAPGVVLLGGAALALVWGLLHAGTTGWRDPATAAALAAAGVGVGALVLWERRASRPLIPPSLFRSGRFAAATMTLSLSAATMSAATFLIGQYLQTGLGYSPFRAGLQMLPWTIAPLLLAPAAGALADRIGRRPVLVTGMLTQAAGLTWFALTASTHCGHAPLHAPLLTAGIGISLVLPTATTAALTDLPPAQLGVATGVATTLQRLGGATGIALATAIFAGHGHLDSPAAFTAGFRPALALAAGLSLLGALTALGTSTLDRGRSDGERDI